jgi:hypothetical protein
MPSKSYPEKPYLSLPLYRKENYKREGKPYSYGPPPPQEEKPKPYAKAYPPPSPQKYYSENSKSEKKPEEKPYEDKHKPYDKAKSDDRPYPPSQQRPYPPEKGEPYGPKYQPMKTDSSKDQCPADELQCCDEVKKVNCGDPLFRSLVSDLHPREATLRWHSSLVN